MKEAVLEDDIDFESLGIIDIEDEEFQEYYYDMNMKEYQSKGKKAGRA